MDGTGGQVAPHVREVLDDGTELTGVEYFTHMGGYLTSRPVHPEA